MRSDLIQRALRALRNASAETDPRRSEMRQLIIELEAALVSYCGLCPAAQCGHCPKEEMMKAPPAASDLVGNLETRQKLRDIGYAATEKLITEATTAIAAARAEGASEPTWDDAVKALRTAKPEQLPQPTIAELEAMLNAPAPAVHINPDGAIGVGPGQFERAANWLAANKLIRNKDAK